MGLRSFFNRMLGREQPSGLRNRAGGMAWIRGIEELNGRVVTTVRAYQGSFWIIDPPQDYVATQFHGGLNGVVVMPGEQATTIGLADRCLEPIRDVGDEERDESLAYLPPVPTAPPHKEKANA